MFGSMAKWVAAIGDRLPAGTIVTNGAGNYPICANRHFTYRRLGTQLKNPDFAALARAYGAFGARVENTAAFDAAFAAAQASGGPALLHLILDPEAITPRTTLSQLRAAAEAAGR